MGMGQIVERLGGGKYKVKLIFEMGRVVARLKKLELEVPYWLNKVMADRAFVIELEEAWKHTIAILNGLLQAGDAHTEEGRERIRKQIAVQHYANQSLFTGRMWLAQSQIQHTTLTKEQERLKSAMAKYDESGDTIVEAWCGDYTEDLSGVVGTVEVPGERGKVQIVPGYQGTAKHRLERDGFLQPSVAGTPAGTFWNLAMLPGWQKWMPTYRHGTITAIDKYKHRCTVDLDSAQGVAWVKGSKRAGKTLDVNQVKTLTNLPIAYMECDAWAFDVGDKVLIWFGERNINNGVVIGFVDNPKLCFSFMVGLHPSPTDPTETKDRVYLWNFEKNTYVPVRDKEGNKIPQPNTSEAIMNAYQPNPAYATYWMAGHVELTDTGDHPYPPPPGQEAFYENTYVHPEHPEISLYACDLFSAGPVEDGLYGVYHMDVDDKRRWIPVSDGLIGVGEVRSYHSIRLARRVNEDPDPPIYQYVNDERMMFKRETYIWGDELDVYQFDETEYIPETYPHPMPLKGGLGMSGEVALAGDSPTSKKMGVILVNSAYYTDSEIGLSVVSNVWTQTFEFDLTLEGWHKIPFAPALGLNFVADVHFMKSSG